MPTTHTSWSSRNLEGTKYLAYINVTSTAGDPTICDDDVLEEKFAEFFRNFNMCTRYKDGKIVKIRWCRAANFTYECNTFYDEPFVVMNFKLALKDAARKLVRRNSMRTSCIVTKIIDDGVAGNVLDQ